MEIEEQTITVPSVEDKGEGTPPQVSEPTSQGAEQKQETEHPQGRTDEQQIQSQESGRPPKVSEFYFNRNKIRTLKATIFEQQRQLASMVEQFKKINTTPVSSEQKSKPSEDEFWLNPLDTINSTLEEREKKWKEDIIKSLKEEQAQAKSKEEFDRNEKESLEILFPKSNSDSQETIEERMQKTNPERLEKILGILSLDRFSRTNPKEAAMLVLKLLEEKPTSNPLVIKKSLMGGGGKGNPSMGKSRLSTLEEKQAEMRRLFKEVSDNESLRFDPDHKKRRESLQNEVIRLLKE